jgi:hypothetical protein
MEKDNKVLTPVQTILQKIHLPPNIKKAFRHTRFDGVKLPIVSRGKKIGSNGGRYENGLFIYVQDNGQLKVTSFTVQSDEHVKNFYCTFDINGKVSKGAINCFGLGWIKMDQDYMDNYFDELHEDCDSTYWDKIITEVN